MYPVFLISLFCACSGVARNIVRCDRHSNPKGLRLERFAPGGDLHRGSSKAGRVGPTLAKSSAGGDCGGRIGGGGRAAAEHKTSDPASDFSNGGQASARRPVGRPRKVQSQPTACAGMACAGVSGAYGVGNDVGICTGASAAPRGEAHEQLKRKSTDDWKDGSSSVSVISSAFSTFQPTLSKPHGAGSNAQAGTGGGQPFSFQQWRLGGKPTDTTSAAPSIIAVVATATAAAAPVTTNSAPDDEGVQVYCICRGPDDGSFMIFCEACSTWMHGRCVGLIDEEDIATADQQSSWVCPDCEGFSSPTHAKVKRRR